MYKFRTKHIRKCEHRVDFLDCNSGCS